MRSKSAVKISEIKRGGYLRIYLLRFVYTTDLQLTTLIFLVLFTAFLGYCLNTGKLF